MASLFGLAIFSLSAHAELSFEAGPYLEHFRYQEFSDDQDWLDSDTGTLSGIFITTQWHTDRLQLAMQYAQASGDLAYRSILANSQVKRSSKLWRLAADYQVARYQGLGFTIHAALSQHRDDRDITSTDQYFGLNERYRHKSATLGFGVEYQAFQQSTLTVHAYKLHGFDASINVEFLSAEFDSLTFTSDPPRGYGLALSYLHPLSSHWSLCAESRYNRLETNRSKRAQLSQQGIATTRYASEPASEWQSSTLLMTLRYTF